MKVREGRIATFEILFKHHVENLMTKTKAVILVLLGATLMSMVGLLMRLLETVDGAQILFYRSISLALIIIFIACVRRNIWPVKFFFMLDLTDLKIGSTLSIAFSAYVFAMLNTSVASTLFILSMSPFFAALFSWLISGERPKEVTLFLAGIAILGVFVMVGSANRLAYSLGNFYAILSAAAFAATLVLVRASKKEDMLGGNFLAGLLCLLIGYSYAVLLGNGLSVTGLDLLLILVMGAFAIGLGIALVTWGGSHLPATDTSLLVLLESVLGPIWVWILVDESMTNSEMFGGILVLLAVAGQSCFIRFAKQKTNFLCRVNKQ